MASTTRSASSGKEARELYELKEKAAKYYAENGVPQKMEEILNSMFYDNPNDVYGHLASYFQGFAKAPTVTKVKARTAIDSKAQTTIQTDVYCTVNNKEKLVSSTVYPSSPPVVLETAKPEEKDEDDKEREENVTAAIKFLNSDVNNRLQGIDPTKQAEADSIISELIVELQKAEDERLAKEAEEREKTEDSDETEKKVGSALSKDKPKSGKEEEEEADTFGDTLPELPSKLMKSSKTLSRKGPTRSSSRATFSRTGKDTNSHSSVDIGGKGGKGGAPVVVVPDEPREKLLCGSPCVGAVSVAVCNTGAKVAQSELYEYIGALKCGANPREYRVPLPMVTILQSGRAAPGKSACIKEYMLVPKPGKLLKEAVPQMLAIYNNIIKTIVNKNGIAARNVSDNGALMISFDRPEQGLDLLQEAMTNVGLTAGEDFYIALNLAGHEIFDYEKGKYEVVLGQQKVADDMVDFWAELLGRYPAVIAIIDPLRKQEDRQWMMLCERISERCFVMGSQVWHRPGLLKDEELTDKFKTSGILFTLEGLNTVTDIIECSKKMEEASNEIVLSTNIGDSQDTFIADMAVGMNARFIKLGAPCRGERVSKLNRLVTIEEQLDELGKLSKHTDFQFPAITIPVDPETEEQEPDEEEVKKDTGKKK